MGMTPMHSSVALLPISAQKSSQYTSIMITLTMNRKSWTRNEGRGYHHTEGCLATVLLGEVTRVIPEDIPTGVYTEIHTMIIKTGPSLMLCREPGAPRIIMRS